MKLQRVLMNENEDGLDLGGVGEQVPDGQEPGAPTGDPEAPTPFLKDWTEDDVYTRLQQAEDLPSRLQALESRLFGSMGPLKERLDGLSKSLGTRSSVNLEALKELDSYDPKLREALEQILPQVLQVSSLDETALQPFLEPLQSQLTKDMGEQIVRAFYDDSVLNEIIPPVENGAFAPQGQRQKDFVDWYAQQGYDTQQALLQLGAPYVQAMQSFERWEKGKLEEREKAASKANARLAGGVQPSAQGRKSSGDRLVTMEDGFYSVFPPETG